jgi:hypothetical protein
VRDDPVEVFTTNYDLLSEQAPEAGVPYFDGFAGAHEPFFDVRAIEDDVLPPRWARLWKLHGSINWCLSERRSVVRKPTPEGIARRLIHPSHLKYDESRRMLYLALHDRLRSALRRPHFVMVTCGYSFRDDHLNEVLREGLERNASAVVFGLLHGDIAKYPAAAGVAERAANLLLLAGDGAVVGSTPGAWGTVDDPDAVLDTPGVSLDGTSRRSSSATSRSLPRSCANSPGPRHEHPRRSHAHRNRARRQGGERGSGTHQGQCHRPHVRRWPRVPGRAGGKLREDPGWLPGPVRGGVPGWSQCGARAAGRGGAARRHVDDGAARRRSSARRRVPAGPRAVSDVRGPGPLRHRERPGPALRSAGQAWALDPDRVRRECPVDRRGDRGQRARYAALRRSREHGRREVDDRRQAARHPHEPRRLPSPGYWSSTSTASTHGRRALAHASCASAPTTTRPTPC